MARHAGTEAVLEYMRSDPDDELSRLVPASFLSGEGMCLPACMSQQAISLASYGPHNGTQMMRIPPS